MTPKLMWSEDRKFVEKEFIRLGFSKDPRWRISDINKDFELCNTYPRFLIIPTSFKDEDLESAAKFRYFKRIPTAVWRHIENGCFIVRSSQPTVGWFGWFRNELDENLVQTYVSNTMPANSEFTNSVNNGDEAEDKKQTESVDNNDDVCDQQTLVGEEDADGQKTPLSDTKTHIAHEKLNNKSLEIQSNHNNNLQEETRVISSDNDTKTTKPITTTNNTKTSNLDPETTADTEGDSNSGDACKSTVTNGNGVSSVENNISTTLDTNTTSSPTSTTTTSKMLIIDARSYTAAMANRAKGGGCECSEYYQRCEVQFMNLANIHSIRKSFHAIRNVCEAYSEQSNK